MSTFRATDVVDHIPAEEREPAWTTREGERIRVSEMSDDHVRNTLRLLRRHGYIGADEWADTWAAYFSASPSGEGAQEGIARSGGVGDFAEGEGGAAEEVEGGAGEGEFGVGGVLGFLGEEDGAEFAEFDDDVGGSFFEEALSGEDEVGGLAEIAGFGFVDDEEVDALEDLVEVIAGDGDPEIHGIRGDEGFFRGELVHHLQLVERVHVGEDDHG